MPKKKKKAPAKPKAPKQYLIESPRKGSPNGSLYLKQYDQIAERMVKHTGATISEIAETLSVTVATIYNWQSRHPSFKAALSIGEETANNRVELSLYNQAVGYFVDEEDIKILNGEVLRVKVKRWIPPNPTAAIFWAKVKMKWSDQAVGDIPPPPDAGTIGEIGPVEVDRQMARRVLLTLFKGGKAA
jgi:hypothetical protein